MAAETGVPRDKYTRVVTILLSHVDPSGVMPRSLARSVVQIIMFDLDWAVS